MKGFGVGERPLGRRAVSPGGFVLCADPQSSSNLDFSSRKQEWSRRTWLPLEVASSPSGEACKPRAFPNPLR